MIRNVREAAASLAQTRDEWAECLSKLEADGHGNSDLAWRIRDYVSAVDRLAASTPPANWA